jgi:hypothetical protein
VTGDDSPSTSLKLEIVEEPSVHQPHHGDDQRQVNHEGEVRGDRGHNDEVQQAEDGAGRVQDEEPGKITFRSTSEKVKPKDW